MHVHGHVYTCILLICLQVSLSYHVENEVTAPEFTISSSIIKETLQTLIVQACVG